MEVYSIFRFYQNVSIQGIIPNESSVYDRVLVGVFAIPTVVHFSILCFIIYKKYKIPSVLFTTTIFALLWSLFRTVLFLKLCKCISALYWLPRHFQLALLASMGIYLAKLTHKDNWKNIRQTYYVTSVISQLVFVITSYVWMHFDIFWNRLVIDGLMDAVLILFMAVHLIMLRKSLRIEKFTSLQCANTRKAAIVCIIFLCLIVTKVIARYSIVFVLWIGNGDLDFAMTNFFCMSFFDFPSLMILPIAFRFPVCKGKRLIQRSTSYSILESASIKE